MQRSHALCSRRGTRVIHETDQLLSDCGVLNFEPRLPVNVLNQSNEPIFDECCLHMQKYMDV
jgi:hypothetical protein